MGFTISWSLSLMVYLDILIHLITNECLPKPCLHQLSISFSSRWQIRTYISILARFRPWSIRMNTFPVSLNYFRIFKVKVSATLQTCVCVCSFLILPFKNDFSQFVKCISTAQFSTHAKLNQLFAHSLQLILGAAPRIPFYTTDNVAYFYGILKIILSNLSYNPWY